MDVDYCIPKSQDSSISRMLKPIVDTTLKDLGIDDLNVATIREVVRLVNHLEKESGIPFVRMELGIPGLPTPKIIKDAEIDAIKKGVTSVYPMLDGVPSLKKEISRYAKLFLDVDISKQNCIPIVGSLQGSIITFMVANRADASKEGTLFIDPGFPVHKVQCKVLGHSYRSMDICDYRGEKLKEKLESFLKSGKVSSILYANPNNPTWVCLSNEELKIIGELAEKYNVIVIEDMAYFGMDFRKDFSQPGKPPYQPTVAKYTDNYVILISSSKIFSYAGERIGMMLISDKLAAKKYPGLLRYYPTSNFFHSMVYSALYTLTAGASHAPQYGLLAMLKAVNDGKYNYRNDVLMYGERAKKVKQIFLKNNFNIVYDKDENAPIADGFYFTIAYKNLTGHQMLKQLLLHGISAITLGPTGSVKTGIRVCVSLLNDKKINLLQKRLADFNEFRDRII